MAEYLSGPPGAPPFAARRISIFEVAAVADRAQPRRINRVSARLALVRSMHDSAITVRDTDIPLNRWPLAHRAGDCSSQLRRVRRNGIRRPYTGRTTNWSSRSARPLTEGASTAGFKFPEDW